MDIEDSNEQGECGKQYFGFDRLVPLLLVDVTEVSLNSPSIYLPFFNNDAQIVLFIQKFVRTGFLIENRKIA